MDKTKKLNQFIQQASARGEIFIPKISDGRETFEDLYHQRAILFCSVCNLYSDISWKSRKHYNEEKDPMREGEFIAGIYTPLGQAAFHLNNIYWDMIHVSELEKAPRYDGYSSEEMLIRVASLGDLVDHVREQKSGQK